VLSFLLVCCIFTTAKVASGKTKISPRDNWKYIAKFAFDIGLGDLDCTYELDSKSLNEGEVSFHLYLDDDWDTLTDTMTCDEKVKKAKYSESQKLTKGGTPFKFKKQVNQFMRPHVWFIAISNCALNNPDSNQRDSHRQSIQIKYEAIFTNDQNHFSYEDYGLWQTHVVVAVALGFCVVWCVRFISTKRKKFEPVHSIIYLLFAALSFEFISHVCVVFHLWRYAYNGYGLSFLNFLHMFLNWGSSIFICCIFILCAWGWTITTTDFEPYAPVFIPLLLFVVMSHFTLIILAYLFDNPEKYHDHETVPGFMLVVYRIGLCLVMAYGAKKTFSGYRPDKLGEASNIPLNSERRRYLLRFCLCAALWFLCLPTVTFISSFCAPYIRHRLVRTVTMIFQCLAFIMLAYQFLSRSATYKKISSVAGPVLGW